MELNREQVKKELVLFIDDTPVELHFNNKKTSKFLSFLKLVLAVITTDEQKIFELENRLKECENGYEGTLYLKGCKLHDAEHKAKGLTEQNAELRREYDSMAKSVNEASELIRKLKRDKKMLELRNESLEIICESYALQYGTVANKEVWLKKERADTVQEMKERLTTFFNNDEITRDVEVDAAYINEMIDQIAKEMLEGV